MKKLSAILVLATITIVGYSQIANPSTTPTEDSINLMHARLDMIDANYKAQTNLIYANYQAQRNSVLRQIEKLQTNSVSNP